MQIENIDDHKTENITIIAAKGTLYSLGGIALSKPLGILIQLLISRIFGAEYFGLFALGITTMKIGEIVGAFGLQYGGLRYLSVVYKKGELLKLFPVTIFSLSFASAISVILATVMFGISDKIAIGWFDNIDLSVVLKYLCIALPFAVIISVGCSISKGLQTTKYAVYIENIIVPFSNLAFFIILYFSGFGFASVLVSFIASRVIGSVLIILILYWVIRKEIGNCRINLGNRINFKGILTYSFPFIWSGILSYIIGSTDMIMLGKLGEINQVGVYSAALQISLQVGIFLTAMNSIFAPLVAGVFTHNKINEIAILYGTFSRWAFLIAITFSLFLVFFRVQLMSLFGPDFIILGPKILVILSIGQFVNMITGGVGVILGMTGHQVRDLINRMISAALNIALNLILIPIYGAIGAAVATAISTACINIGKVVQVYIIFGIQPFTIRFLLPLLLSVSFSISFYCFESYIPILFSMQNLILGALLCIGISFLTAFYTLSNEDRRIFMTATGVTNFLRSIKPF